NITDDFVYKIVEACSKLELLCIGRLKHYKPISDQTIVAITHSCPNLHHLFLKDCHNITDVSVNRLLQHIYNLEYLELNQFIDEIAQHCSSLKFLSIQSTNISKDALSKLNPKIKIKRDLVLNIGLEKELNDLW
ncbi:9085_t:CDS:2, partial [Funneliformis caledonium]